MTIKTVLRLGDPILQQRSIEVDDPDSYETQVIIEDMFDTMHEYKGAGLAAPQIGILKRIVIFGFESNPRYPDVDSIPETILINPVIEILSTEKKDDWEGCLSVPGLRGLVSRPDHIRYSGYDKNGAYIEKEVKGFHARVVQHECDHLDGILYVQRMKDMTKFGFISELEQNDIYNSSLCDTCEE